MIRIGLKYFKCITHHISIRMAKKNLKNDNIPSTKEHVGKLDLSYMADRNAKWYKPSGKESAGFS